MRLKAPEGVTQFQASSGQAYPVGEDGHIEVTNETHAQEAMHRTHGFKPAPAAPVAPQPGQAGTSTEDPFVGMTKDDLRDWLDERDVDYPNRASKDDLLALARSKAAE